MAKTHRRWSVDHHVRLLLHFKNVSPLIRLRLLNYVVYDVF